MEQTPFDEYANPDEEKQEHSDYYDEGYAEEGKNGIIQQAGHYTYISIAGFLQELICHFPSYRLDYKSLPLTSSRKTGPL